LPQPARQQAGKHQGVEVAVVVGGENGRAVGRQAFAVAYVQSQQKRGYKAHNNAVEN